MEDFLQQLNPQQLAAVKYDDGPSLVIAGAGSGKTRVLTNKIMYLVKNGHDPRRIMALTFTNKAANEMRERIAGLIGLVEASKLWMGTFHSVFLRILHSNAERICFTPNFTIYDTSDSKSLIKTVIKDMQLDEKDYPANVVASIISRAKNSLVSPTDYMRDTALVSRDNAVKRPMVGEIYSKYWSRCRAANAMDFDDILFYTNILLRDHPDVLERYQDYFTYILVDEYQDTNFAQHLIVSQLCKKHRNLCVVGDDAQSIYSFRGANIRNILSLPKQYPDMKMFKLEQNYRSTKNILNAANSLIAKNKEQIQKNIFSDNPTGGKIPVIEAFSDYEESYIVANKLIEIKMLQGGSYEDFAILYRTNAQSRVLEESLRKRNIPYRIYGGLSFYQHKEIKDALCYFRVAVNPDDDEALRRIINFPARGIGEKTLLKLRQCAVEGNVSMWEVIDNLNDYPTGLNSGAVKKLDSFKNLVRQFIDKNADGANAYEMGSLIFSSTKILSSLYTDNTPENISKQENLNELLSAMQQFVDTHLEEGAQNVGLYDFLSEVSLATDQDTKGEDNLPRVTLMTVHAAKGLEFRNVIIVGVEDELFPSIHSSGSTAEIEEERRLLYVAITRAQENCVMTYAKSRYINGQTRLCSRSRFISDIDPDLLKMSVSNSVEKTVEPHDKFRPSVPVFNMPKIRELKPISEVQSTAKSNSQPSQNNAQQLKEGMRIRHDRFGEGVILKVDQQGNDEKIEVRFRNVETKTLLVKFAKFTIIE